MFIAHLPAGYVLSSFLQRKSARFALLAGSIAPDIDLIYFYTFGQRAVVHHAYATHMPWFWIICCLCGIILARLCKKNMDTLFLAFFGGTMLHLFLDSFTGGIHWLAPLSDTELIFFTVPSVHSHWTLNFILHWTFWLEIIIILIAGILFLRNSRFTTKKKPQT